MTKASKNKKVVAVVVTYNRKELLKECINALLNQDYNNCDILIVDNASTDGTKEFISKELKNKKVHYVNTGSNLGGAGGFNFGMKEAYSLGCDYMWLMDDDCIVKSDSLSKLINYTDDLKDNFGFLSSKVLWKDNSICKMNIQKNSLFKKNHDWNKNAVKVIMATFVSFFVPVRVIEDVGLPISDFFIWADDLEFSRRISRKYNCYLINESVVTHKSKNNIGSNIAIDESENLSRYNYSYRNERYIFRREGIIGRLYYFLKIKYHKLKILKSKSINKKEKFNIINSSSKIGKNFNPLIEYVPYNKKKILYMYGECIDFGGQETFTLNILNFFDKKKFIIDLFTPYVLKNQYISEAVKNENGKIYAYNGRFEHGSGNKKDFYKYTKSFLKEYGKKYEIIHINSGSTFCLAIGAKLAKKYSSARVIVHSHATGYISIKHSIVKFIFSHYFRKYTDFFWSCSKTAAYWKFPKSIVDTKCKIIKNTIDVKKYAFDTKLRHKFRKKYGIDENALVLGTIGRLSSEKNHNFLLDVFREVSKQHEDSFLIIVGDGPLMSEIQDTIKEKRLKNVIMLGKQDNVNEIINCFDIFILPSIYEGFPLTVVETQANNLPCIFSKNITDECKINENVVFVSLQSSPKVWSDEILNLFNKYPMRKGALTREILEYDTTNYVKEIEKEYCSMIKK